MKDAFEILFQNGHQGRPLFKNQLELVNALLREPETDFYSDAANEEHFLKDQIRLKTLISQLLSPHVTRGVPAGFQNALSAVITKKINDGEVAEEIAKEIVEHLRKKNTISSKVDIKRPLELLRNDFKNGNYVAIITSTPLEIEADIVADEFSTRQLFITDFLDNIQTNKVFEKRYRLLFPVLSSCTLFWRGLKEIVHKHLKENKRNLSFILNLRKQVNIDSDVQHDLFDENVLSNESIDDLTVRLLTYLNKEGLLRVFLHEAPIFTLPLIAITPAELKNAKVYSVLSTDKESLAIHKFSLEEVLLWRHFVWDRLKLKPFFGESIAFSDVRNSDWNNM